MIECESQELPFLFLFRAESKAAPEPLEQQSKYRVNIHLMDFIVRHNALTWRFFD